MKNLVNARVQSIGISGARQISNKVATDPTIINLTLGQPDIRTPDYVKQAGKKAIDENQTGYTHNAGIYELRKAVSDYMRRHYDISYSPEDEIIVTAGGNEAIEITLRTILEEGDEVILPSPSYQGYEPNVILCGGVPVYADTRGNNFKVTADMIEQKISEKTRCIVLNSPANPTGTTLEKQEILRIAELLRDKDIFVLSDEIYSSLTFGKQHYSVGAVPELREKSIIINGLSKSHAMTGWRIGFLFAPSYLSAEILKIHLLDAVCASTISQYAALEAVRYDDGSVEAMRQEYERRRDYAYERAISMGLDVHKPEGAFYLFPSIQSTQMSSLDFVYQLIDEEKIALTPGTTFSKFGEGYVRISLACSMEILEEGFNRIERFLHKVNTRAVYPIPVTNTHQSNHYG